MRHCFSPFFVLLLKPINANSMNIIISLYGLPACGKTTQAEKLAKEFGLYHFGMGNKIRAEIKSGSELGQKIKVMNDAGVLVPDELMIQIIQDCGDQAKKPAWSLTAFRA